MSSSVRRRNPGQGKRSQSCFELQGNQYLHASLSTASLSFSHTHTSLSSQPSQLHTPGSSLVPFNGPYKPTKASRLRACSAPVARAAPDYRHMARRRKESILAEKILTAKPTQRTEMPDGETLHSFLVGGRYNSAHHVDVRSLQRLGVYVPRNSSAKAFINSAGTTPPSPAVYGLHPLRKHLPLVVDRCSTPTTDRGLLLVKQDLKMQLNEESTASRNSLTASRHSFQSKHSSFNLISVEHERTEGEETQDTATKNEKDMNLSICQSPIEGSGEGAPGGDEDSASSVVSASNLLSPEAQQLTQEILLETVSVSEDGNRASTPERAKSSPQKLSNLSVIPSNLSEIPSAPPRALILRSHSATSLRQPTSQQKSTERPQSAFQPSRTTDPHRNSAIFVDLSKLQPPGSAEDTK